MKRILFFFYFILVTLVVRANNPVDGNYISLKKSYDFNFPQFDLALKLPANAGFWVPLKNEKETSFNINERNVSYCYNTETTSESRNFSFSLPKQNTKALSLSFKRYSNVDVKYLLGELRKEDYFVSDLPPVKSKLGTCEGILVKFRNQPEFCLYFFNQEDVLLTFIIYVQNDKEVKQCKKIIQSLQAVDLKEEREKYLSRVKDGYFEKKKEVNSNVFVVDTTQIKTNFSFPEFGLKMLFPENWIYRFYGKRENIIEKKGQIDVHWNINDLLQSGDLYFSAYNKNLSTFTHIYPKINEADDAINRLVESQKQIKKFPVIIDGMQAEAVAVGAENAPTIHFRLMLNSYILQFTVMSITAEELPTVEFLLSAIRISEDWKRGIPAATKNIKPITEQLNIKEFVSGKLPVIELNQPKSDIPGAKTPAVFEDTGISFMMPKGASTLVMPKENRVPDSKRIIVKGKPDFEKGNLFVTTLGNEDEGNISVTLSLLNNELTFDNYFEMMVDSWKTYDIIKMKRTGFTTVNGQKWGIMEYSQVGQSVLMITTFHNDCIITVTYSSTNKNYKTLTEDMLFSFRFNN